MTRKFYDTKDGKRANSRNIYLPAGKMTIDVECGEGLIRLLFLVDGFLVGQVCISDEAQSQIRKTHDMRQVFKLLQIAINSATAE